MPAIPLASRACGPSPLPSAIAHGKRDTFSTSWMTSQANSRRPTRTVPRLLPRVGGIDRAASITSHLASTNPGQAQLPDYPKDPAFRAQFGPRGVMDCKASTTDDQTVDPHFGKVGKQVCKDTTVNATKLASARADQAQSPEPACQLNFGESPGARDAILLWYLRATWRLFGQGLSRRLCVVANNTPLLGPNEGESMKRSSLILAIAFLAVVAPSARAEPSAPEKAPLVDVGQSYATAVEAYIPFASRRPV